MAEEYQQQQQSNICSSNWWINGSTNNQSGRSGSNGYDHHHHQSGSGVGDHLVEHERNKIGIVRPDNSVSVSGTSTSMMFLNTNHKLPGTPPGLSLTGGGGGGGDGGGCGVLVDPNMQVIGLGLSSQGADWDQTLLRGGKADQSSFRSMLQEEDHHISSSPSFQQEIQWKHGKIFPGGGHGEESSLNRGGGFSLEQQQQQQQPQFSSPVEEHSTITCHNLSAGYIENHPQSIVYGESPSSMLQSLLGSNSNQPQHQQQQNFFDQRAMDDYSNYGTTANYGGINSTESQFMPLSGFSSSNKFPQFANNSPPNHQQQLTPASQLQFSNNAPYWNAVSARSSVPDVRTSFISSLQPQFPSTRTSSSFEEKPNKNNVKQVNKDSSVVVKKSGSEASSKRPRNESSPSTLPPFKVKKEKMGDRITALQQLVSPFGKTDTASVLSESIEYIKILHEQVLVLTTPYLKNGAMIQQLHHQHLEKSSSKDSKAPKQDLRSRGLCLVPLSSTFPVTHETSVDFWTPTFGGPLR